MSREPSREPKATRPVSAAKSRILRFTAIGLIATTLLQPYWVGMFRTGDVNMVTYHATTAAAIMILSLVFLVTAILVWRPGRGPKVPMWAGLAFFAAIIVQSMAGMTRLFELHFPVGVAMAIGAVGMFTLSNRLRHLKAPEPITMASEGGAA